MRFERESKVPRKVVSAIETLIANIRDRTPQHTFTLEHVQVDTDTDEDDDEEDQQAHNAFATPLITVSTADSAFDGRLDSVTAASPMSARGIGILTPLMSGAGNESSPVFMVADDDERMRMSTPAIPSAVAALLIADANRIVCRQFANATADDAIAVTSRT